MFFGGKFLNGFAIGTLKAISTTYIGEVKCAVIAEKTGLTFIGNAIAAPWLDDCDY